MAGAARTLCVVLGCLVALRTSALFAGEFAAGKAGFSVRLGSEVWPYREMAVYVLPGEAVDFAVEGRRGVENFEVRSSVASVRQLGRRKWQWKAPEKVGLYHVRIVKEGTSDSISLNVLVMVPFSQDKGGYLNAYRIGEYPETALKGLSIYERPRGFVEVTEENLETLVSPHFKVAQFVCKQDGGYPKYLVLSGRLLQKLESILEKVNESGYRCDTLHVMSGYRTPYYNQEIGNVPYSLHVFGGAADVFIDADPVDDLMDDLNRDGHVDENDAKVLYEIIDDLSGKPWHQHFAGGLARYGGTEAHGPFVHVDVRGFHASWGN